MKSLFVKNEARVLPNECSRMGSQPTIEVNDSFDSSSLRESTHFPSFHSNSNSEHHIIVKSISKQKPRSAWGGSSVPDEKASLHAIQETKSESIRLNNRYQAGSFDVWVMSMTTVLGGVYYGWNEGLASGFGSYFISQTLMGLAYIVLICALAEIISITSFSGGAYGMTRVVLGFYPGFMVAAFEFLEYISYTSAAAKFLGDSIVDLLNISTIFVPIIGLGFYLLSALFLYEGNFIFWRFNAFLGILCLLILIIYFFVSLGFSDFEKNASLHNDVHHSSAMENWFSGGLVSFIKFIPLTTWGYGGIESAALVTDMIDNPRTNFPRGITAGVITLFAVMTGMLFVAVSLPSNGLKEFSKLEYFMDIGWSQIGVSDDLAEWLILPAQFAMGFGFILPSTRLLYSMSQSKLLSTDIVWYGLSQAAIESSRSISSKPGSNEINVETYRRSLLIVMILSYALCLLAYLVPSFDITNLPILCAFITYLSDLYAFTRLRTDFTTSDRQFQSPFGILGAVLAGLFFILGIVSIVGFQKDSETTSLLLAVLIVLLSLYYFLYAKHRQVFSDQEQKTLLTLHVMSNNRRKRMKKLRQKWSQKFTSFISSKKSNNSMISSPHATRARRNPKPVKPASERVDNQLALSEVASPRSEEIDLENESSTLN